MVLLELKPLWRKEAAPNFWRGRLGEFSAVRAGKIFPGLEKQLKLITDKKLSKGFSHNLEFLFLPLARVY